RAPRGRAHSAPGRWDWHQASPTRHRVVSPRAVPASRRKLPASTKGKDRCVLDRPSEVSPQVHSTVETRDLFRVAVEGKGRPTPVLTDPPLRCLTPSGVVDVGIHVRVE